MKDSSITYKHTQIGHWLNVLLSVGILFNLAVIACFVNYHLFTREPFAPFFLVLLLLIFCLAMFWSLTVSLTPKELKLKFGAGLICKSFNLNDIESFKVVKNPWYYGWGIHLIPGGLIYNISGFYALELKLKSGKRIRIGSDEPENLEQALKDALKS
jgi:hypothetical protein